MALWSANDVTAGAPKSIGAQFNKAPNTGNRDLLYQNNTPDAFITGKTVGLFAIAASEIASYAGAVPHTGWNLRTTGSGGRAGRVHHECLVAGGMAVDAVADISISITTQPLGNTVANNAAATFRVTAKVTPNAAITYQWQLFSGSFADIAANATFTNVTTAAFVITNAIGSVSNNAVFRVRVMSAGAVNVFSSNAVLSITA